MRSNKLNPSNKGPIKLGPWSVSIELFTKSRAEKAIATQTKNRKLRKVAAKKMSKDMSESEWFLTHQGIAFDSKGKLLDGQHRLMAIILSEIPQHFVVFRGLEESLFDVFDLGNRRNTRDVYNIHKGTHPKFSAQVIASSKYLISGPPAAHLNNNGAEPPRDIQIAHFAVKNEAVILNYIQSFYTRDFRSSFSSGWVAAFLTAQFLFGRAQVDPLVHRFAKMNWTGEKDPMKALYRYIIYKGGAHARSNTSLSVRWSVRSYLAAVKGIKAAIAGREIQQVRVQHNTKDFDNVAILRKTFRDELDSWLEERRI